VSIGGGHRGRSVGEHFDGDLRRALLDAAADTLDETGVDGLSLREVARRVGVSHAAPAHHFGDKTGLLTALAAEGFELFIVHLGFAAEVGAESTPPVDQLASIGWAYADFADRHPGHFDVMFRPGLIRTDDPAYASASNAAFEALMAYVGAFQSAGWRAQADTRALSAAAWALAHGIAVLRMQGSLALHYPDTSLGGTAELFKTLVGDREDGTTPSGP
jgi:AcrR family transcriptional regulator